MHVITAEILFQRREIGRFAVAAQQQMQGTVNVQAIQRRFGTADVGGF